MSHPQRSLEVTRALLDCARAAQFDFGEDTALVAVQHMLRQTVDLFRTMGDMGLSLENIFALGKVYSNNVPVIRTLRDMGVTVIDTTLPAPGEFLSYFQHDINRLWKVAADTLAQRRIKRVLILDDAGVCITSVPNDLLQKYALCGVEQTSQGMFLFEEKPPAFAVFSWARTAVKLEIGGPVFSQSFIDKLNTQFLHGRSSRGARIGIVGLGSIGKGIANLAARQGNRVLFYDANPDLHIPSSLNRRITRANNLEELMVGCDYVLGCSGRNPFNGKWPLAHKPGLKLLSASGGDQEFNPIIKYLKAGPDFRVAPHTWDITSEHGPSGRIHIAYLGYPYNFVCRGPEVVRARIVQIETGGLLAALMQARMYLDSCENGQQKNRGIHRVSPKAQCFVYERWLRAMKARSINLVDLFGYDPGTLSAARHDGWFIEKTEPHPREHYTPLKAIEDMMTRITYAGAWSGLKREPEPNFGTLGHY